MLLSRDTHKPLAASLLLKRKIIRGVMSKAEAKLRVGFFIDAENMVGLHQELAHKWSDIAALGESVITKAYAEWTWPHIQRCKLDIQSLGIEQVQQDSHSKGKNSSDIAISIAVTESVLTNKSKSPLDVVVLVTNDSDFSPLVEWLKKQSIVVVIVGSDNTSKYLKDNADAFLNIKMDLDGAIQQLKRDWEAQKAAKKPLSSLNKMVKQVSIVSGIPYEMQPTHAMSEFMSSHNESFLNVLVAFRKHRRADYKEYVNFKLPALGEALLGFDPGFKPKTYGHKKLSSLLRGFPAVCKFEGDTVSFSPRLDNNVFVALLELEYRNSLDKSYNGFQTLTTFMRRLRAIRPDLHISKENVLKSLARVRDFVHVLDIDVDHVLWVHKGVASDVSRPWLAGLQHLLKAIELHQRQWGQSVKMSPKTLRGALNVGKIARLAQYGANGYDAFLAQYGCLIRVIGKKSDKSVYVLGKNGESLHSYYESRLLKLRKQEAAVNISTRSACSEIWSDLFNRKIAVIGDYHAGIRDVTTLAELFPNCISLKVPPTKRAPRGVLTFTC